MKKARGQTKKLLIILGKIQDLVGHAKALHDDDRSRTAHEQAQNKLIQAFDLCIKARSEYEIEE